MTVLGRCTVALGLLGALAALGGCPTASGGGDDTGGDGGDTTKAITGRWSGTIDCTSTQSLGGAPTTPRTSTTDVAIEFDAAGLPTALTVIGFSNSPNMTVTIRNTGQSQTVTNTVRDVVGTYVVTVRSATYTSTTARVTLDIVYSSTNGPATSEGTGVQVIEATVNGDVLGYKASVEYDVTVRNVSAGLSFDTEDNVTCVGDLARQ